MLRGTQINYMPDKSHAIIIIINTQRPNRTNLFHKEIKIVEHEIMLRAANSIYIPRKGAFQRGQFTVTWLRVVITIAVYLSAIFEH